jgi:predicted metal-binding protein
MSCKNCDSCEKEKFFTFHNVRISVSAKTAKDAYAELAMLLSYNTNIDYETDTYSSSCDDEEHSTEELFGE